MLNSAASKHHNGDDQPRVTSPLQTDEDHTKEMDEITLGINSLVCNLHNEPPVGSIPKNHIPGKGQESITSQSSRQSVKPIEKLVKYSRSPGMQRRLQESPYNGVVSTARAKPATTSSLSPQHSKFTLENHSRRYGKDSQSLSLGAEQHLKRISDISISSNTSQSSQSSTDEFGQSPTSQLLKQTHIAIFKFIVRHEDEIGLEMGDAIAVHQMFDDLWFEGTNLKTGQSGLFPSRYVASILQSPKRRDSLSSSASASSSENNQFYLRFLGSVEVKDFKGNEVLCAAMKEIVKQHQLASGSKPPHCTLDISVQGIKITYTDLSKEQSSSQLHNCKKQSKLKIGKFFEKEQKGQPDSTHYFFLKNVTFCGCHPNNTRYFAFITKHPKDHRFACHVFMSEFSTEPVAFAIGKVFKEFYAEFLDHQVPVEEFYME